MAGPSTAGRGGTLLKAAGTGAAAGLVGVAAVTAGEKVEQLFTSRPNSYVPARTLLSLLGHKPDDGARPPVWNHAMHWGTGAVLGALRGVWAVTGIRGPVANSTHTVVRLATRWRMPPVSELRPRRGRPVKPWWMFGTRRCIRG